MRYKFSDLRLDVGRRELTRDGQSIKLPKLSFEVLRVLVEAAPNLVTHDELVDGAWGDNRIVSPENLSQRVKLLRESIGDDAQQPRYIESVRGQGIRLIPPVERADAPTPPGTETPTEQNQQPPSRSHRMTLAALVAVVAVALLTLWVSQRGGYERTPTQDVPIAYNSVAVLPFTNLSPDPNNGFFAAGVHEEVLNQLAKLTSLRVISRTSMLRYQDTLESIPDIARELEVDSIVEGSVRYADDRIRVTVQLVNGQSDEHVWSETYDRSFENIFEIESDIARDVAAALHQSISEQADDLANNPPTRNLDAYAHYVQGRQLVVYREAEELKQAVKHFKQATALDPEFALAWVGLADAQGWVGTYTSLPEHLTFSSRQAAIDKALELDPSLGEAWLSLAGLRAAEDKFEEAEKYYLRSLELTPGNAQAYHQYGWFLNFLSGRSEEALPYLRKAVELDPMGPAPQGALAHALFALGRTEEALEIERKRLEYDPKATGLRTGMFVLQLSQIGRLGEAMYYANRGATMPEASFGSRISECTAALNLGNDGFAEQCYTALAQDFATEQIPAGVTISDYWPDLLIFRGQYEQLLNIQIEEEKRNSNIGTQWQLAYAHVLNGNLSEARGIFEKLFPQYFGNEAFDLVHPRHLLEATFCGLALLHTGDEERANYLFDQVLSKTRSMHRTRGKSYGATDILVHIFREDHERAISALRSAIDVGWRQDWWRLRGPGFASIEQEPEWLNLVAELEADVAKQRQEYETFKDDPTHW